MRLVVDSSVGIKWVIRNPAIEPDADRAVALLRAVRARAVEVLAPPHFVAEVLAVVARERPLLVPVTFGILRSVKLETVETETCYRRATDMAMALKHHLFDTLYHATAIETGATFVTADRAYFAKASGRGNILLLSSLAL